MEYMPELQDCNLFEGMSYDDIHKLLECIGAYTKEFSRGALIVTPGQQINHVLVVLKGVGKTYHGGITSDSCIPGLLNPMDSFGTAYAIQKIPTLVSVRAVVVCNILFLPYEALVTPCENSCPSHIQILRNLPLILSEKVTRLGKKLSYTHRRTLRAKLSAYLLDMEERVGTDPFTLSLNRTHLSEYLDASRTAMTRELNTMKEEGLIWFEGNSFSLLDKERLLHASYE